MNYANILKPLGLNEKEAIVYTALLKFGEGTALEIAKETNLKRPTVYVVLDELRKKEVILKAPQSKRNLYIAKSPNELYNQHIEKIKNLQDALPKLNAMHKKSNKTNILYFEGLKGVEESLYYRLAELKNSEITGFWGKVDRWTPEIKKVFEKWVDQTTEDNISSRAIAPDHPSLSEYRKRDKEWNREVKVIPYNKYSSNVSIETTDLFVRISQLDPPQAIIIESLEFVKTIREIFDLSWSAEQKTK